MDPTTFRLISASAGVGGLPEIGDFYEGGYFAGYISQTANGVATHGLLVAPAASGYNGKSKLQWQTSTGSVSGTASFFDGATNTANMATASNPAANYCAGLTINGYSDWYLPARYELEIAYYNLKPTSTNNYTSFGTNAYSVPARSSNYTTGNPGATSVYAFGSGQSEAFVADNHWSSSEFNAFGGWLNNFSFGGENNSSTYKLSNYYVRAFRKFAV